MEIALDQVVCLRDPDLTLVKRMAEGDEDALRTLYASRGRSLYAYALKATGNPAVAEEVLQDSLLAAWKGARGFRGDSRVITWLLGIVHRQSLNAIRRKRLPLADPEQIEQAPSHAAQPEDSAMARDRRHQLLRGLDQLSIEHRLVIELVFYHELRLEEVATVCDCPVGTVKSRLSYAKSRLREALGRAGLNAEDLL